MMKLQATQGNHAVGFPPAGRDIVCRSHLDATREVEMARPRDDCVERLSQRHFARERRDCTRFEP